MPSAWTVSYHTAVSSSYWHRGGETNSSDYRAGISIWQIWLPKDNSHVKERRVACELQESRADLEERRLEGTAEAAEKRPLVAQ